MNSRLNEKNLQTEVLKKKFSIAAFVTNIYVDWPYTLISLKFDDAKKDYEAKFLPDWYISRNICYLKNFKENNAES